MLISNSEKIRSKLSNGELIVLLILLMSFLTFSVIIALRLDNHIIPDEPSHFIFSKHYSTTWVKPPDTLETYSRGWYIDQNPFLYYWINGRLINLTQLIYPSVTDAALLVILRLFSCLYSLGTLIFLYLLSKLIIHKTWWRLLPVFLLSNTLMFVFLSGGVNYDNLANFMAMGGIYYLSRVLNRDDYVSNSLLWMIFIGLGCLVKYPITPLALFAFLTWLVYSLKNRLDIFPVRSWDCRNKLLAFVFVILFSLNASIYGYNLLVYRSLTPRCLDILNKSQCDLNPFALRYKDLDLTKPMSLKEAVQQGYPHPLTYLFEFWIKDMLNQVQGIMGHRAYFPSHIIPFYQLFFLGILCLAFQSWKEVKLQPGSLLFLVVSYSLVVFLTNYKSELGSGFRHWAVQGRYLFPIIGPVYVLVGYTLSQVSNKVLRFGSVIGTIVLFLSGGPLKFIKLYETVFSSWLIH